MSTLAGTSSWSTTLDPVGVLPLHAQLYEALREAILQGVLSLGARLPSSRALRQELGVSRNTVLTALDQLVAEGYLEGRPGSGMFVVARLPEELLIAQPDLDEQPLQATLAVARTAVADNLVSMPIAPRQLLPFISWLPALDHFPVRIWSRLMKRRWAGVDPGLLIYGPAAGFMPLREAVAAHLSASRAVNCTPDQVLITAGAQHGLSLVARVLVGHGARAVIEDPGYKGADMAMRWAGAEVVPVPVDSEGLDSEALARLAEGARLAYVTPSHQYPLGMVMTVSRRLALLEWARLTGAWILEDDYDSEYRFAGRPLPSLQGMDACGRVIYMGTFSKVLFPSLRLGYLVLPTPLTGVFAAARAWGDLNSPTFQQAVLADFITDGHFGRHLRRMRALYAHRHTVLIEAARRHLTGLLDVQPSIGGMHTVGWLPDGVDAVAASRSAAEHGVVAHPLQEYASGRTLPAGLLLGFAGFDDIAIDTGVRRLATALAQPKSHSA